MAPLYTRKTSNTSFSCSDTSASCVQNLFMPTIHLRIKRLREQKKLSMEQLANEVGVTWQTVQQWENGKTAPKRARTQKVANALGVSVLELILGSGNTPPKAAEPGSTYTFIKRGEKEIQEVISILESIDPMGVGMILQFSREVLKERTKLPKTQQ